MKWHDYSVTIQKPTGVKLVYVRALSEADARYALTMPCKRNRGVPVVCSREIILTIRQED